MFFGKKKVGTDNDHVLFFFTHIIVEARLGKAVLLKTAAGACVKPRTDEQVFLDKFLNEFTYASVRRTSFP